MRFSNELVALVAVLSFGAVTAAPVAVPEANAAPTFTRNRYGGGYNSPHFVQVGSWKRDVPAKAPMKKRQEPGLEPYGREDRCKYF